MTNKTAPFLVVTPPPSGLSLQAFMVKQNISNDFP